MPGTDSRVRDPLAVAVALISIGVQVGFWFYWGGKMETRIDGIEKRQEQSDARINAAAAANAGQDVTIAVMTTQLSSIQSTVERIDKKLEGRR